jgi:hypothetical protein
MSRRASVRLRRVRTVFDSLMTIADMSTINVEVNVDET